jgi:hypothetical protein
VARWVGVFGLGAIDAIGALVDTLDDPNDQDMRLAALLTLRHWTSQTADRDLQLQRFLTGRKNYTEVQADLVLQLLHDHGMDPLNPVTYQALLGYLRNDRLAVRELAYWRLSSLDPDGPRVTRYNPAADADARNAGVAAWEKRIPDGKLPPDLAPPPPPPKGGKN